MPNPIAAPCPAATATCEPAANPGSAPAPSDASFAKTLQGQTAKASAADNGGTQSTAASAAAGPKNAPPPATEPPPAAASAATPDQAAGAQAADAIAAILALLRPQTKAASATAAPSTDKLTSDPPTSSVDNGTAHPEGPQSADMTATAAANAAWAMTVTAPTQTSSAPVADANAATSARSDNANLPANLAGGEPKQANTAPASHGGSTLPVVAANANANANANTDVDVDGGNGFQAALTAAAGHETTTPASIPAAALASAAASAAAHSAAPAAPMQHSQPILNVASPVGSASWSGEVGDRLNWMIGHQEQRADLVLNPPHLGRIEVSLSLNGDQASALFVSANPAVRDAISNAIPQLREQMAAFGVSLGQTQVGADSAGQSAQQQGSGSWRDSDGRAGEVAATGTVATTWLARGRGLVDTFA
jgi:flagellar hook-length control protein FliK